MLNLVGAYAELDELLASCTKRELDDPDDEAKMNSQVPFYHIFGLHCGTEW